MSFGAPPTEDHPAPSRGLAPHGRECLVPAFTFGNTPAIPLPAAAVRELFGLLERVTAVAPGAGLPAWAVLRVLGPPPAGSTGQIVLADVNAALAACGGNETEPARRLGVTRGKLRRFLAGERG